MFIRSRIEEMEISDIIRIHYRPDGNDIGETIPAVGFLSRKDLCNGKIYLSHTDPSYRNRRYFKVPWEEKEYNINGIEYLFKITPLGMECLYKNPLSKEKVLPKGCY